METIVEIFSLGAGKHMDRRHTYFGKDFLVFEMETSNSDLCTSPQHGKHSPVEFLNIFLVL
jgi:hypothetical protein